MKLKYLFAIALLTGSLLAQTAKPSLHTYQENIAEQVFCSGTAIGPQALITATHCEVASDEIVIRQYPDATFTIVSRIRDGNDHTIYLLSGGTFTSYAEISVSPVTIGEDITIIANPGHWEDVFQKGYVAGVIVDHSMAASMGRGDPDLYLLDIQSYPGESGGGIFGPSGKLVAVLSGTEEQIKHDQAIQFATAYPLAFKPEELTKAKTFITPALPAAPKSTKNIPWVDATSENRYSK